MFVSEDGLSVFVPEIFRQSIGGIHYRFYRALSEYYQQFADFLQSISDAQLPDNSGFSEQDAHEWYARLGLYDSGSIPFADMKAAILQKLSFPTSPLNAQSPDYITAQLALAGFSDVKIYRNEFGSYGGLGTLTPSELFTIGGIGDSDCGAAECGDCECNSSLYAAGITKCFNYLEEEKDALLNIGENYKPTFYVCSVLDIYTRGNVLASRKTEFRQLLFTLKSAHTIGLINVNYI